MEQLYEEHMNKLEGDEQIHYIIKCLPWLGRLRECESKEQEAALSQQFKDELHPEFAPLAMTPAKRTEIEFVAAGAANYSCTMSKMELEMHAFSKWNFKNRRGKKVSAKYQQKNYLNVCLKQWQGKQRWVPTNSLLTVLRHRLHLKGIALATLTVGEVAHVLKAYHMPTHLLYRHVHKLAKLLNPSLAILDMKPEHERILVLLFIRFNAVYLGVKDCVVETKKRTSGLAVRTFVRETCKYFGWEEYLEFVPDMKQNKVRQRNIERFLLCYAASKKKS